MSSAVRRRCWSLAAAVLVLVAVIAAAVALATSGARPRPPDTGAARLVPADALAYVNVSLDRSRPGVRRALRSLSRLPDFGLARDAVLARLGTVASTPGGFAVATRPWLGDAAALAVLTQGGAARRAASLILLAVRRPAPARQFLERVAAGSSATPYRGVPVYGISPADSAALVGRYVVIGAPGAVRAAIDVARHAAPSLLGSSGFRRALAGQPPGRAADLYASAAGVAGLLGGYSGLRGGLRVLLDQPGLLGLDGALSAAPGGLRLRVHSVYGAGSGRAPASPFAPSLLHYVPAGAAVALETSELPAVAPRLLAALSQVGIGAAVRPLLRRLGRALKAEGADVQPLLNLFSREAVVALTAAPARPALLVLTRTVRPAQARVQLASLAPALASLFPAASSGPGVAPLFTSHQIGNVLIHQLKLGPGLQVNYAVYRNLVGISTGVDALAGLGRAAPTLPATSQYRSVLGGFNDQVSSLVFLDLKVLFRLGQQAGLLGGAGFRTTAPDLTRIPAIAVRSRSGKADSTSELYFKIS